MSSTAETGHVTLRFLAAPTDAGQGGSVGGGRILEWIDKAGFACAAGWSGRYRVTAYVGNIDFHRPVAVGEIVEVSAQLVLTGRTSMTLVVDVSSGDPRGDGRGAAADRAPGPGHPAGGPGLRGLITVEHRSDEGTSV